MRNILTFISAFIVFISSAFGQTPSISINVPAVVQWRTCIDAPYRLPVKTVGQFGDGNKFTVQVRGSFSQKLVTEIPATLSGNDLEFVFKDASLYVDPVVQLRIVSSIPKTESPWMEYAMAVYSKGEVTLAPAAFSDTLNLYENLNVRFSGYTTSGATFTLNDSTKIGHTAWVSTFNFINSLQINREGTYTIAHAENECGTMKVSGSVTPVVNRTLIRTLSVNPQTTCENAEVRVSFSTSGTPLTAQTKYKIRFSDVNSNDTKPNSVDVPAELKDGYLIARFPDNFKVTRSDVFTARVVTENPALVDSYSQVRFTVWPKPQAIFETPSQTVNVGDPVSLYVNLSGLPPFTVELSDGSIRTNTDQGPLSFTVQPYKSTSYSVKSMSSGCENAAFTAGQSVEIKVNPGIKFADELSPQIICAGTDAIVKFQTNANLTDATEYWIKVKSEYNSDSFLFRATRSEDNLKFQVPPRSEGYSGFSYQIITANPALQSRSTGMITVQTRPEFILRDNIYTYELPSKVRLFYILKGGPPYDLEKPDGSHLNLNSNGEHLYEFYLKQTEDFKMKSVSNSCFKNENIPAQKLTIIASGNPGIFIEPIKTVTCNTDSIEVTFGKVGTFNTGNNFLIQGFASCCDYQTLATVKEGGKYKVKISAEQLSPNASIRIASTNPVLFSETQAFTIQALPVNIKLYPEATADNPIKSYPNQPYSQIGVSSDKGVANSITYSENGVEKTVTNTEVYSAAIPVSVAPGRVNEYFVKSVSNECGTVPVNLKTYIQSVPYLIRIPASGYEGRFCAGGPISVAFGTILDDSVTASFSLQIIKEGAKDFITLAGNEKGRVFNTTIPSNTEAGIYGMRILSSDGIASDVQNIRIGSVPTAQLSFDGQTGAVVSEAGRDVAMKLSLTGGPHWTVVFEDNSRQVFFENEEVRHINPTKGGQFLIKSVSNICGYGTASGILTVNVKPSLTNNSDAFNVCEGGTFPVSYSILGDADLSDDYIRFELIDLSNNSVTLLDSTKKLSGTVILKMPAVLNGTQYQIRLVIKKYNLVGTLNAGILTKPGATLRGSTTINAGESTTLLFESTKNNNAETNFVLSDGTKGSIYGPVGSLSYVSVSPKQTTTYTITSLTNTCGAGTAAGSAIVEVNPVSERSIKVSEILSIVGNGTCIGDTILLSYAATGSFTTGNKMTVQISDSTGRNFQNIATIGNSSPLRGILPLSLVESKEYRIRVSASDPGTSSSAFSQPISVSHKARARFASESVIFDGTTNPKITVLLEGGAPWTFQYGTDQAAYYLTTYNSTNIIELLQASPSQYYRLFSVSNACGPGIVDSPSTVQVGTITGIEEVKPMTDVVIFPNPVLDVITIRFSEKGERTIRVFDSIGRSFYEKSIRGKEEEINFRAFSAGTYMIEIQGKDSRAAYKIVKQ